MQRISEYDTIHDFWLGLKEGLLADLIDLRGKHGFRDLFETSSHAGHLITRLNYTSGNPTQLRVSEKIDEIHGYSVTQLSFREELLPEKKFYRRIGNLTMSGYPALGKTGLQVLATADIPRSEQQSLDSGIFLLEENKYKC